MFASDVNWHIYACTCTVLKGKYNTHVEGIFGLKEYVGPVLRNYSTVFFMNGQCFSLIIN